MSIYPHAATSVHAEGEVTAKRLVTSEGDAFVTVEAQAETHTRLSLDAGPAALVARTNGVATMFLSEKQAIRLAAELMRAVRREVAA